MTHSRFEAARKWLVFWTLFIGIGAVAGATEMLVDPSGKAMGMAAMLPYFQVLLFAEYVFQDFVFSGIALLIVNGLSNLIAAGLLLRGKSGRYTGRRVRRYAHALDMHTVCYIPAERDVHAVFHIRLCAGVYGLRGVCVHAAGKLHRGHGEVQNIGRDKTRLVVYFPARDTQSGRHTKRRTLWAQIYMK